MQEKTNKTANTRRSLVGFRREKSITLQPQITGFNTVPPPPQKKSSFPRPSARNKLGFYGEELSVPCPTQRLEEHPLSALRDCLFNIFLEHNSPRL